MELPSRTVIYDDDFEGQLAALIPDASVAEEYLAAAKWVLATNAQVGIPVEESSPVWLLPMSPIRGHQVSLFYTFDLSTVLFLAIVAFEEGE